MIDIIQALIDIVHFRPPYWNSLDYLNSETYLQFCENYPEFDAQARDWTARQK